jgi:hypothetical protein
MHKLAFCVSKTPLHSQNIVVLQDIDKVLCASCLHGLSSMITSLAFTCMDVFIHVKMTLFPPVLARQRLSERRLSSWIKLSAIVRAQKNRGFL